MTIPDRLLNDRVADARFALALAMTPGWPDYLPVSARMRRLVRAYRMLVRDPSESTLRAADDALAAWLLAACPSPARPS